MELQSSLADILGFEELDLVVELIEHRQSIVKSPDVSVSTTTTSINGATPSGFQLLTAQQQLERLRQADFAHKTRELGPKLIVPETQYPHVYKSHDAGNTLSFTGKKYDLPSGSKREEFEVSWIQSQLSYIAKIHD